MLGVSAVSLQKEQGSLFRTPGHVSGVSPAGAPESPAPSQEERWAMDGEDRDINPGHLEGQAVEGPSPMAGGWALRSRAPQH